MEQSQLQQIKTIADIFLQRKKLIISCVLVTILCGLGIYLKTPKKYQATSLIMYQKQSINPTSMSPDVQTRTREMISTLTEQVTSRTNLEEVIKQFELYPQARKDLPMQDVVDKMRSSYIQIKPERGDVFKVTFQGKDPKKVMMVTNALAAKFIEENLRFRALRATETSAYVKDELDMAKKSIDKKEEILRDYKLQYYNEMPQQLQVNMSRLNSLQEQYQNNQNSIQEFERMKLMLNEQISLREEMLAQAAELEGNAKKELNNELGLSLGDSGYKATSEQSELAKLKLQLTGLKAKYTDKHPEVRRTVKLIKDLEAENKEKELADEESTALSAQELEESMPQTSEKVQLDENNKKKQFTKINPQIEKMELQLKDIHFNIARLKKDGKEIVSQIDKYKKWVANTPIREAEWSALTRDYDELKHHYENLVTRNLQAESAESLERRQKGSQFKVVDPGHFPEKPFQPDFFKIMIVALVFGLGLGGGLAFVFGTLDSSFKDVYDVESLLELPVLTAIPIIYTTQQVKINRIKTVLWTLALVVSMTSIIGLMGYLWRKGHIIL